MDLDINNVRALLMDAGETWGGNNNLGHYQVPKGNDAFGNPYPEAIFAGTIWVSALDQGNNLKIAAQRYTQGTGDFYTGPLDNSGNISVNTCNLWDQHFRVYASDIRPCIAAYNIPSNNNHVPDAIISSTDSNMIRWPGKGNPYLAAEGYDVSGVLAPFFDVNGDGIYDPHDGDYPAIKQVGTLTINAGLGCNQLQTGSTASYADEMIFWVMNDIGNTHTASNGNSLGIQINALGFAYQSSDEINNMTFYRYNLINKSGAVLNNTYFSQWTDVDLGCANNDRVGCDTSRNLAITYNGYVASGNQQNGITCDDGSVCPSSEIGYGCDLPMLGIQILEGAIDTIIDPLTQLPKKLGMTSFCTFSDGAPSGMEDPYTAVGYRNYQTGFWNSGSPFTYGGMGYNGSVHTNYLFTGDPSIASQWSECNPQTGPSIAAGDRRFVQTSGPFTFMPCASQNFTIAVLFIQPSGGVGSNCPSWSNISAAADSAISLRDANFRHFSPFTLAIDDISSIIGLVYPNPVSDLLYISNSAHKADDQIFVYDLMGRQVISQNTKTSSIDMSQLPDGVYLIKASSAGDLSFRVVKRK